MFLEALGQAAVDAVRRVAWFSLEPLGVLVRLHRADDSVTRAIARILRASTWLWHWSTRGLAHEIDRARAQTHPPNASAPFVCFQSYPLTSTSS